MANNFKLTLDTLAPTGSIKRPAEFLNAEGTLTIDKGDATHMKVWFDTKEVGDKADVAGQDWELAATSKETAFTAEGNDNYYYHLLLKDDVANESVVYNTEMITFDTQAPTVTKFEISDVDSGSKTITNAREINYVLTYADNLSGVKKAYITGDHIDAQELDLAGSGTIDGKITIKATAPQGVISVSVKLVDNANNESEITTVSITLDTELSKPVLVLETVGNADDALVLPEFINYHDIQVQLSSTDKDIVGYKIWEEGQAEPAYTDYEAGKELFVEQALTLSANDGEKKVHAKVIDSAGTEIEADVKSVKIDTVKPVVSLEASKTLISAVDGYNSSELTMSGTDAYSNVKSYTLKVGETVLSSGNGEVPASYTLMHSSLVEGDNTIVLEVIDIAENKDSKSIVVELDKTAPVIELPQLNTWYTAEFGTNLSYTEKNAIAEIYVWSSTTANDTTVPTGATNIDATASPIAIATNVIKWNLSETDKNYLHVKVMDEVGNVSYLHPQFGYDSMKPTGTIKFEKTVYGNTSAKAMITYEDKTGNGGVASQVAQMQVRGDITNPSTDWEAVASTRDVTLTTGDGQKEIEIKFKDVAGNESDWIKSSNKAELDQSAPGVGITLYKADGKTAKPAISAEAETVVEISVTDDVLGLVEDGNVEYCLWGDFEGSAPDTWVSLTMDEGKATKSITVTVTNANAEEIATKNFNVKVRDAAGNVSETATASFRFDPTAPTAEVVDLDHNRISKVHVYRNCMEAYVEGNIPSHVAGNSYADEVKFVIKPSEVITEWKVCAYLDEAGALAGSAADTAIGNANGSENVSGTTNSSSEINCMVRGADYEIALGGRASETGEFDGIHYVVVYVKNEAGLWSAKYIKA